MQELWRLTLTSTSLLALVAAVAACGSPQLKPTPLNIEELRSLAQKTVRDSIEPRLTSSDVKTLVQGVVESDMAPGVILEQGEEAIASDLPPEPTKLL